MASWITPRLSRISVLRGSPPSSREPRERAQRLRRMLRPPCRPRPRRPRLGRAQDGRSAALTFAELQELSARFANFLPSRGIGPGDVVRRPAAAHARTARHHSWNLARRRRLPAAVHRLRPEGDRAPDRVERGETAVVTDPANRPKLDDVANCPPSPGHGGKARTARAATIDFRRGTGAAARDLRAGAAPRRRCVPDDVHLRHHRPAEGRRRPAQGAAVVSSSTWSTRSTCARTTSSGTSPIPAGPMASTTR